MTRLLAAACLLAGVLTPTFASANPEPTAYDTRSISMGLTGTSYMERASALVLNPANMEGIEKLGFTFNFTGIFTNQIAPVQGPGTRGTSAHVPGGAPDDVVELCSRDQVVRTGCRGQYGVFTYWTSASFTLQY